MNNEVVHYVKTVIHGADTLYPLAELAWTYVPWLVGEAILHTDAFDEETLNAWRKALFDRFSEMPFSALFAMEHDRDLPGTGFDEKKFQAQKTAVTRAHRHEFSSFNDVFLIEIRGQLDAITGTLADIAVKVLEAKPKAAVPLVNAIHSVFRCDVVGAALPGLRIFAGIAAIKRYRNQPFKKGDLHDSMHARMALPYCDHFLTEKRLGNLLTQPPLEYDRLYDCQIIWREDEVLDAVSRLCS
jgi:hypothetical protein